MNPFDFTDDVFDLVDDIIEVSKQSGVSVGRSLPVSVWAGFSDLGSRSGQQLLAELKDAGASKIVFTPTNDAARKNWAWQPARSRILRGLEAAKSLGFEVELGPWCRCDVDFMDRVGLELRTLADEAGGVSGFELDCEGSFEVTAKARGARHRNGLEGAVDDAISALRRHLVDGEELSATLLYFERPAGSYLLRSKIANVRRVVIQAYSVWLKNKATHKPNFQPDTLQRRAWSNYLDFKEEHDIDKLDVGLGWWAQDRTRAPASLRLPKPEAFRRASKACVELGCDGVSGWACHLFDGDSKVERERRELVLREIRYLSGRAAGPKNSLYPEDPDGASIDWSFAWNDPSVASGGRPAGYHSIRGLGLSRKVFGEVASKVRRVALATGQSRGWCVPYIEGITPCVAVFQKHTATWIQGKRVDGLNLDAVTVFAKV